MKLFLTSSIGGSYYENGVRIPCALDGANHLLVLLREYWPINSKCLLLSSDPDNVEKNDSFKAVFTEAFRISNLPLSKMDVCDIRNESNLKDMILIMMCYCSQVDMSLLRINFSTAFI